MPAGSAARALACLLAAVVLPGASPAPAEPAPASTVEPAVGRLNRAGFRERRHCTAALIAPRVAVTALHCVGDGPPGELHLVLGYDRGGFGEHRRVRSVVRSPMADVALLCLDADAAAEPLPSERSRPVEGRAFVRGYAWSRAHVQQGRACRMEPVDGEPQAILDCPLEQGFSGAPVRSPGEAGPVIGVASASNERISVTALLEALPEEGCPAAP